ncbi:MAG: glycosyltransferase family 4 protein [Phycisphaerales bacterium]
MLRVAFASLAGPDDLGDWSGLPYHMAQCIRSQPDVELIHLGPLKSHVPWTYRVHQVWGKYVRGCQPLTPGCRNLYESYARQITRKLRDQPCDAIFAPSTHPIALLRCDQPIVFWTDATFRIMLGTYVDADKYHRPSVEATCLAESWAMRNCAAAIYASEWASRSAINDYGADPAKLHILPFGANIDCDRTIGQIAQAIADRDMRTCRMLFVGKDWLRKGGEHALEVVKQLNKRGLPTRLQVVGATPNLPSDVKDYVEVIGFLDKAIPGDLQRFHHLFTHSHFLLMPSRFEAFGVVFAEAGSYGVPSLACDVGGIPNAVRNDINGRRFSVDAPPDTWANYVIELFREPDRYRALAASSFREYETRLNWNVIGGQLVDIIRRTLV